MPLSTQRPLTGAGHERAAQWVEDYDARRAPHPARHPAVDGNMERIGTGGGVALPLVVGGTAIGVIGIGLRSRRRLSGTERATLVALAEQCAQALDRARLYRGQQRVAEALQPDMLPPGLPALRRLAVADPSLPGAAGTQAGGDWYDAVDLDETCVASAVGDAVGQGPAAAAVMGQLRSALSTALLTGHSPAEAL